MFTLCNRELILGYHAITKFKIKIMLTFYSNISQPLCMMSLYWYRFSCCYNRRTYDNFYFYRVHTLFSQLNLKLQIKLQIFLTPLICNLQFYAVLVYRIFMFPNMIYTCKQIPFLYLICTCLYKE